MRHQASRNLAQPQLLRFQTVSHNQNSTKNRSVPKHNRPRTMNRPGKNAYNLHTRLPYQRKLVCNELEAVTVSTADILNPGVGPQSLRGLPNGFPSQQQLPQNRSVSNRLPQAGKLGRDTNTFSFKQGF